MATVQLCVQENCSKARVISKQRNSMLICPNGHLPASSTIHKLFILLLSSIKLLKTSKGYERKTDYKSSLVMILFFGIKKCCARYNANRAGQIERKVKLHSKSFHHFEHRRKHLEANNFITMLKGFHLIC